MNIFVQLLFIILSIQELVLLQNVSFYFKQGWKDESTCNNFIFKKMIVCLLSTDPSNYKYCNENVSSVPWGRHIYGGLSGEVVRVAWSLMSQTDHLSIHISVSVWVHAHILKLNILFPINYYCLFQLNMGLVIIHWIVFLLFTNPTRVCHGTEPFCTTNLPGESSIPNHHPPGNSRNINYVQHSIFITRFNLKQTFEKQADQASTIHLSGVCWSDSPGFSYHRTLGFTDS